MFSSSESNILKMPLDSKPERIIALPADLDQCSLSRESALAKLSDFAKRVERSKAENVFRSKYNARTVKVKRGIDRSIE